MAISRSFLLRFRNVSDKIRRKNQSKYFMCNKFFSKIVSFMRQCGKLCHL
jgi:hypothetical protein